MNIHFIESFDGGSHREFREHLVAHSRHEYRSFTLPPRFWKWRMRGAAAWFADQIAADSTPCDLILATSLLNAADLKGLLPAPLDRCPMVLYMHENQLTYPLSPLEEFDFHFGFTNIISCLAADRVVFNSDFHRDLFHDALPEYVGRMPEAVPRGIRPRLEAKSMVLPVGIPRVPAEGLGEAVWRGGPCDPSAGPAWPKNGTRPVILWNHRWEFDKRPDLFATALETLLDQDLDFEVIILGEGRPSNHVFQPLVDRLGPRCLQHGFAEDRQRYEALIQQADIVVSCAEQEYFGIAVAEAVHAGAYPVLPRRQVYPSLYGSRCKGRHFYETEEEFTALLAELIAGSRCGHVCSLSRDLDEVCWSELAPRFDVVFESMVDQSGETAS